MYTVTVHWIFRYSDFIPRPVIELMSLRKHNLLTNENATQNDAIQFVFNKSMIISLWTKEQMSMTVDSFVF